MAFLFGLSELLESFSVARARRTIQSLLKLSPETALLKDGDVISEVPVEKVHVGQIIAVRSGARILPEGRLRARLKIALDASSQPLVELCF